MIAYGGWTRLPEDQARWDGCTGGHPGGWYRDEHGDPHCPRCGRLLDLDVCGCGTAGHEHLSRSFCPVRMRDDQRAVARPAEIAERDGVVVARIAELLDGREVTDRTAFFAETIGFGPGRTAALFDGQLGLSAALVGAIADALGVRATWLIDGTGEPTTQRRLHVIACPMPSRDR